MTKEKFSPTRRSILRLGAMSALGIGVGIPAVSGSAAATACPRTPGYWANHPDAWEEVAPNPFYLPYHGVNGNAKVQYEMTPGNLLDPSKGLKNEIMAKHLMATILNFQWRKGQYYQPDKDGPVGDPCVDRPIKYGPYEGMTVRRVKQLAQIWLLNADKKQRNWHVKVEHVQYSSDDDLKGEMLDGEAIKNVLDYWNNDPRKLGLYDCPCRGDD